MTIFYYLRPLLKNIYDKYLLREKLARYRYDRYIKFYEIYQTAKTSMLHGYLKYDIFLSKYVPESMLLDTDSFIFNYIYFGYHTYQAVPNITYKMFCSIFLKPANHTARKLTSYLKYLPENKLKKILTHYSSKIDIVYCLKYRDLEFKHLHYVNTPIDWNQLLPLLVDRKEIIYKWRHFVNWEPLIDTHSWYYQKLPKVFDIYHQWLREKSQVKKMFPKHSLRYINRKAKELYRPLPE